MSYADFYLSGFPLVSKVKHSFSKHFCPESSENLTTNACNWLPCPIYMTGGKSGTTKLVISYMWPSREQKKYKIGANLQLIWAGCHSYCQGGSYRQNLTKISTHSAPLLQNKQTVFHKIRGTFGCVC